MRRLSALVATVAMLLAMMAVPALAQEPEELVGACNGEAVTVEFRGAPDSASPVGFIDGRPIIAFQFGGEATVTDIETGEQEFFEFEEERRGKGIREDRLVRCTFPTDEQFVDEEGEFGEPGREYRVEGEFWVLALRPGQQGR